MAQTITVDVSAIVDGQNADAADVTTPIANLKTAVENLLNALQDFDGLRFTEIATPSTPAANKHKLYFKSDGGLYTLDDAATETNIFNPPVMDILEIQVFS